MKTNSSAATKYRDIARAKRASEKLHEVELPSGAVWKLRTPPIQQFVAAGKLPASLVAKVTKVTKNGQISKEDGEQLAQNLTSEELTGNIIFNRDLLLHCAVEPEISLDPDPENENQIAPEEILPEDFEFLMRWVQSGGKAGESLETFRGERSELTLAGSDGTGVRAEAVEDN